MTDSSEPESNNTPPEKPSFFTELKRRKVVRVAITYAIVAWLIIQVASATFGWFEIPAWAFRFVTIILILGFPVAMIITWAFELTPDGVKLTKNVSEEGKSVTSQAKRNWTAVIFGTLALVFYFGKSESARANEIQVISETRPYVIGSVAVLPLKTISALSEIESLALGLDARRNAPSTQWHETARCGFTGPVDFQQITSSQVYRCRPRQF